MKFTMTAQQRKFLIGLSLYAVAVVALSFLPFRWSMFGLFILGAISFALALWGYCRGVVTVMLIVALLLLPAGSRCQSQDPPPDKDSLLVGCVVVVVGAVIVYGLWKICKSIPPVNPPPPPPPKVCTNCPPGRTNTNTIHHVMSLPQLIMPDHQISLSTNWQMLTLGVESSANGRDWQPEVYLTNWLSLDQHVCVSADSNGKPIDTNWDSINWTNDAVMVDVSQVWSPPVGDKVRLWRMVDLQ